MSDLERIGVSLDKKLLGQFDNIIARKNYPNRSEAIRDLIRHSLSEEELKQPTATAIAAVSLVYDHHSMRLAQRLTEIQHHHLVQTISSVHIHLDHDNCLEIIILKGKVKDISKTAELITALKGVKLSRVNLITTGEKLS